ncbi:hypothetical protein OIU77_012876 [Salix suchowensis]|uniref:Uncharacterized protein n=1 Tax=Salix suchowensis TaxID=1278906 RepID=A0ABQ9A708_9ROSI|nr:hypothetical protein OIU77_012876 [Salix suchowensis]KAJ6349897.1 hypothetical protein OIU78_006147 [Salix suchowensis]
MALSVDRYRSGLIEMDRSERSKRFESTAAVKLQKVYRSYRTRRRLADSAVVAEELWWQALDYARLNHSTVSFFSFDKPETAASRWNALQPFFYWLDIGDGKEIDLKVCPRIKLCQECIQYLGPQEREQYEYIIAEGTVVHKQNGNLLDTNQGLEASKWIFVMSTCRKLYAGEKKKGAFHHSSFLAGGTTLAAGRLTAENGKLRSISAYSGHYRPTNQNLGGFLAFLEENGINLNEIRVLTPEDSESCESRELSQDRCKFGWSKDSKQSKLHASSKINNYQPSEPSMSSQTTRTCSYKRMLSANIQNTRADVPKKEILQRIKSKKEASSYQLGNQLSLKWSTGAGPRIGCVADYPLKLREQALTFVYHSPSDDLHKPSASELPGCLLSIRDLCRMM